MESSRAHRDLRHPRLCGPIHSFVRCHLIHLVSARNVRQAGLMVDETHLLWTRRLSQRGQREIKAVVLNDIRCEREWVLYTSPDSSFSTRSEWPRNPRGPSLPKWSSSTTTSHPKGEKRTQANTSHLDACRSISAPSSRPNNTLDPDANKGGDLRAGNSAMQEKALEDATSNVT